MKKFLEIFYKCLPQITIFDVWIKISEIKKEFFVVFCTMILKIKIFKKWKKMSWAIILLQMCTLNQDHMIYGSWNIRCQRYNFLLFWPFFTLSSPWQPRKSKFWKTEKYTLRYYHFTHVFHKWLMMYGSWDMKRDRQNFLSFWTVFCPFTPPNNPKNQKLKKRKKCLAISSFYMGTTNYDHMLYGSWWVADRQTNGRMDRKKVTCREGCPT